MPSSVHSSPLRGYHEHEYERGEEQAMTCRQCGRKNAWQSEFCAGCGASLEPPPAPPPAAPESGAESWRWVAVWTLVALVVVGLLCIYAFQPEGKFQHERQPDAPAGTLPGTPSTPSTPTPPPPPPGQ
jgi:hypothetical protein